jgi:hydroxymethylglutaryl-CoA reductase (NADPH)
MATNSDLLDKLMRGELKFHQLDTLLGERKASELRLKVLEKKLDIFLRNLGAGRLDPEQCRPNIENMIGSVQVPLGIAGPVLIKGENAKGEFFLPLATSEGALVASVNRGCSVINKAGGADALILKFGQTRSILFKAQSINDIKKFITWIRENFPILKKVSQQDEKFIDILAIEPYAVGLNVWLRIKANTFDAMGMNMITIAGKKLGDYVTENFSGVEFVSESGNMCTDKKASAMNLINSRARKVMASVDIPENVIKDSLKTTSSELIDMNYRKNLLGSAVSGSLGFNAHFANIISAMFIATGQDAAHTVDGSLGFTTVEKSSKGVNFTVTLPDLQCGTIGGGTGLPCQRECLSILGVAGPGNTPGSNANKLAEIIGVAVLAGEISLLGALCSKDLSKAHVKLNR